MGGRRKEVGEVEREGGSGREREERSEERNVVGGVVAIVVEPGEGGRKVEEDEGYVEEEEGEGQT